MVKVWKGLTAIFGAFTLALALIPSATHLSRERQKNNPVANASVSGKTAHVCAMAEERLVRLYGPVDGEMADNVKVKLRELDAADPGKPIAIVITSKGGLVPAGLDIIDTMASL